MVPLRYNLRSLARRKITTAATAIGIMLVVGVLAGSCMLNAGVTKAIASGGRPDNVIILRKGSDAELASAIGNDYVGLFTSHPQINQGAGIVAETVIIITAELSDGSGGISNVSIRGTTEDGYKFRPELKIVGGRLPKPGTNEAIVGRAIAGRFTGIKIGDKFDLKRNRPLEIVGEFEAGGTSLESEVIGDRDTIRRSLGREGVVSSVRLRLNSPSDFDAYRTLIEGDKRFSMKVLREDDYYARIADVSRFLPIMFIGLAILFSIAAALGAAITMNGAIAHRTREIGTLRALGFSRFAILTSFLFESILIALIGGIIGCLLVSILTFFTFSTVNFATFSEISIEFVATPGVYIGSLIFAVIMGLIGGLVPAIRAARISPTEAMRG